MRTLLIVAVLASGVVACKKSSAPEATANVSNPENNMDDLIGEWNYATDPKGEVGTEALYATSRITFGKDGSYTLQLEEGGMALSGNWTLRETTEEGFIVDTDYGNGRKNVLHLEVRRDGSDVAGFVVREGEARTGGRYYAR